jgi:large subunit ribosomal protein L15
MRLSEIADNPGSRKKRMRVGRGIGSGKGKTAGRGGKGQTARSGVRIKGFEGGQMPLHRRLPKRGFNNIFALDLVEINLDRVQAAIDAGKLDISGLVNAEVLVKSGALRRSRDGVRLLGRGEIKAKVTFEVHGASHSAVAAVEKAGGSVKILAPRPVEEPKKEAGKKDAAKAAAPKAEAPKADGPKKESGKKQAAKKEAAKKED